jgi:glycosyltransferase involved in cell wall biosynthesis
MQLQRSTRMTTPYDFSIITPSLNSLAYLKRCCASVMDQTGVTTEHLVMDGGSSDGTADWLKSQPRLTSSTGEDSGMYDAINKGLQKAKGSFVAYLNCDEQYLPSTLQAIKECFRKDPSADIVFGDMLVIKPDGSLLACRKAYSLRWPYVSASHLYVSSCCLFWRRRIMDEGYRFSTQYRTRSDADFVIRLLRNGFKACHLKQYLAAFAITDRNLGSSPLAAAENLDALSHASIAIRTFRHILTLARRTEKVFSGAYFQRFPVQYEIYTPEDQTHRKTFTAQTASMRWPG